MGSSGESDRRIIFFSVAMAIAGGAMLVRILQGDGDVWATISVIGAFVVVAIGVYQFAY